MANQRQTLDIKDTQQFDKNLKINLKNKIHTIGER